MYRLIQKNKNTKKSSILPGFYLANSIYCSMPYMWCLHGTPRYVLYLKYYLDTSADSGLYLLLTEMLPPILFFLSS